MIANLKKVLAAQTFGTVGLNILKSRPGIEIVSFPNTISAGDFITLLRSSGEVSGLIVGLTPVGETEIAAAKGVRVVARLGVGYDVIDVPALTRRGIPLMVVGTANAASVAEQAIYFMLTLAKRGAELDAMVKGNRWGERFRALPVDLIGKTILIVGFGRIGSRTAKRCLSMAMTVLVHDPYLDDDKVRAAGCEPVRDLNAALPRAEFVTIHCPKTAETIGMFNAARLGLMRRTAYLINTARGGIIDELALYAALSQGRLAGAGLDVFAQEPVHPDNPLLKLPNVLTAPHMAGLTVESIERMAEQAALNVLSVFDGRPIKDNVVNRDVLSSLR
jgi:D-3-phosphoglycerate dehydrogenase / 2-oxoglutarate reductase